ncbi:MAG: methyl-accepting chemotaxis protein [Candidatus Anammoxibacter sp.]
MKEHKGIKYQLGLRTLLNIGSGVAIIGIIFIGVFSILNLYKIKSRIDMVNTTANEVSITVAEVTKSLEEIDAGSNKISNGMANIKSELETTQLGVQGINDDMQALLVEPLGEVAHNLKTIFDAFERLASNYERSVNSIREIQGVVTGGDTEMQSAANNEIKFASLQDNLAEIIAEADQNLAIVKTNILSKVTAYTNEVLDAADMAETMGTSVAEVFSDSMQSISLVIDNVSTDVSSALATSSHAAALARKIKKSSISINDISAKAAQEASEIGWIMIIVVCVITAGVVFMAIYTKAAITRPITNVVNMVRDIAEGEGDLTKRIVVNTKDEIGELAQCFNVFIEKLHVIISSVKSTTMKVASSSSEIAAAINEQASIATQQSSSVSEITSTMEELSATSTQIAENANKVVGASDKALGDAKEGAASGEKVMHGMNSIAEDNRNSVNEIVELSKKSKEITKVMEIINNVADQTKLIAFNAAIEASSAGEAGKRFAVVAGEIRRLADNVMESTGEITTTIEEIQEAISRIIVNSENGTKRITESLDSTSQTVSILEDLVTGSEATNTAAKQISLATQQQRTASAQVVTALKEIAEGAKQSSVGVSQTSAVTDALTKLASNLKEQVERFKLNN